MESEKRWAGGGRDVAEAKRPESCVSPDFHQVCIYVLFIHLTENRISCNICPKTMVI